MLLHSQITSGWNCIGILKWSLVTFLLVSFSWQLCIKILTRTEFNPRHSVSWYCSFNWLCLSTSKYLILLSTPNNGYDLHGCFQRCLFTAWNTIQSSVLSCLCFFRGCLPLLVYLPLVSVLSLLFLKLHVFLMFLLFIFFGMVLGLFFH